MKGWFKMSDNTIKFLAVGSVFILIYLGFFHDWGLTKENLALAESTKKQVLKEKDFILTKYQEYQTIRNSPEFNFFKMYAARESWQKGIKWSYDTAITLDDIYNKAVQPVVDRNSQAHNNLLKQRVKEVKALLAKMRGLVNKPFSRMQSLTYTRKSLPTIESNFNKLTKEFEARESLVSSYLLKQQNSFPNRKKDIISLWEPLTHIFSEFQSRKKDFYYQYKKHLNNQSADYAILEAVPKKVAILWDTFDQGCSSVKHDVSRLSTYYSKLLVDQRVEYFVKIARTTWDSDSDWGEETTNFTSKVDRKTYNYYKNQGKVAVYGSWLGVRPTGSSSYWSKLNINAKANISWSHDEGEFWVDSTYTKAYHKYKITDGKSVKETSWEQVNLDYYDAHSHLSGKLIEEKKKGKFDDETTYFGS